ncbi:MAG: electron transfer flavoprotein subunit alpha/FixB family protein [Magnetococcales bacterium]|nr:electron transfer flavoprotein subunit alpha/FixB family protein [Magnetococcales bacterium]
MSRLILAETRGGQLTTATWHTVGAAAALPGPLEMLIAGWPLEEPIALPAGLERLLLCRHPALAGQTPELLADLVASLAGRYRTLLAPATSFGRQLLPRLAARIAAPFIPEIVAIDGPHRFVRPAFAGNILETIQAPPETSPLLLSVRPSAFPRALPATTQPPTEWLAPPATSLPHAAFRGFRASPGDRPELGSAAIVVAGGRGLVEAEGGFALLEQLATRLGAAIGATRSAVDAGLAPGDWQIGQTGKIIAPRLYIAIGISGAVQHLAGIKGAGTIVAINRDAGAPICAIADYVINQDLRKVLPEWLARLEAS